MGQAKLRGTYETRVALAESRKEESLTEKSSNPKRLLTSDEKNRQSDFRKVFLCAYGLGFSQNFLSY